MLKASLWFTRRRGGVGGSKNFYQKGYIAPVFSEYLNDSTMISNSCQWDAVWFDGDLWKHGLMSQAICVSPKRDLVIALFSVNGHIGKPILEDDHEKI